jgi:hypothetical protein
MGIKRAPMGYKYLHIIANGINKPIIFELSFFFFLSFSIFASESVRRTLRYTRTVTDGISATYCTATYNYLEGNQQENGVKKTFGMTCRAAWRRWWWRYSLRCNFAENRSNSIYLVSFLLSFNLLPSLPALISHPSHHQFLFWLPFGVLLCSVPFLFLTRHQLLGS